MSIRKIADAQIFRSPGERAVIAEIRGARASRVLVSASRRNELPCRLAGEGANEIRGDAFGKSAKAGRLRQHARRARSPERRERAFTLLEVMIAVGVIALITISLTRFVTATLLAIRVTSEANDDRHSVVALVKAVETELQDLPPRLNGAITGIDHKFDNLEADELTWYCKGGNGLFTKAAEGEWYSTLTIQRDKKSNELEIGLRRRPIDAKESDYKWWPLLRHVSALEVRYFDKRLGANGWVARWPDKGTRPSLVRLRIWREGDTPAYEAVIAVPSANLQQ